MSMHRESKNVTQSKLTIGPALLPFVAHIRELRNISYARARGHADSGSTCVRQLDSVHHRDLRSRSFPAVVCCRLVLFGPEAFGEGGNNPSFGHSTRDIGRRGVFK